jgi:hypothetical protein
MLEEKSLKVINWRLVGFPFLHYKFVWFIYYLFRDGISLCCQTGLKILGSSGSPVSSSRVAGTAGTYSCAQVCFNFFINIYEFQNHINQQGLLKEIHKLSHPICSILLLKKPEAREPHKESLSCMFTFLSDSSFFFG